MTAVFYGTVANRLVCPYMSPTCHSTPAYQSTYVLGMCLGQPNPACMHTVLSKQQHEGAALHQHVNQAASRWVGQAAMPLQLHVLSSAVPARAMHNVPIRTPASSLCTARTQRGSPRNHLHTWLRAVHNHHSCHTASCLCHGLITNAANRCCFCCRCRISPCCLPWPLPWPPCAPWPYSSMPTAAAAPAPALRSLTPPTAALAAAASSALAGPLCLCLGRFLLLGLVALGPQQGQLLLPPPLRTCKVVVQLQGVGVEGRKYIRCSRYINSYCADNSVFTPPLGACQVAIQLRGVGLGWRG